MPKSLTKEILEELDIFDGGTDDDEGDLEVFRIANNAADAAWGFDKTAVTPADVTWPQSPDQSKN